MALIEEHDFVNYAITVNNSHVNEVKNWLENNATEYFSYIGISSAWTIQLRHGGSQINLDIASAQSSYNGSITLRTGTIISIYYSSGPTDVRCFYKAIKTDHGIVLLSTQNQHIFITKSDTGSTVVVLYGHINGARTCIAVDLALDNTASPLITQSTNDVTVSKQNMVFQSSITTRIPIVTSSGSYTPNLFWTRFTQSKDFTFRRIKLDDEYYYYDGVFALRE